jgi:hypothetical protein
VLGWEDVTFAAQVWYGVLIAASLLVAALVSIPVVG